jgi:hypothetical protein
MPTATQGDFEMSKLIKLAAIALTLSALAAPAHASAFAAWQVTNVPWGDLLNARKYPSPQSQKQAAYPNGTVLSMTGPCTNGVNLQNVQGLPNWKQRALVKNAWCQLWHDPKGNGVFVKGWVRAKFIKPS